MYSSNYKKLILTTWQVSPSSNIYFNIGGNQRDVDRERAKKRSEKAGKKKKENTTGENFTNKKEK